MNMPLAILNRRRRGFTAFSPSALFALAEPGVWYDPSDLTTLFQDTAGTTPVTTPGQTVALMLDKSKGPIGPDVITNGDFSSGTTGWLSGSFGSYGGTFVGASGKGVLTTGAGLNYWVWQALTTVIGRSYRVSGSISATSGGNLYRFGKADNTDMNSSINSVNFLLAAGSYNGLFTATATTTYIVLQINSGGGANVGTAEYDNISVKELPGNHATQATAASRPTYGVVPLGGRRNLLSQTDTMSTQSVTVTAAAHTLAFTGTGTVTLTGASIAGPLIGIGAGNRVSLTFTPSAGSLTMTVVGSVTLAQLELGSAVTNYQRVSTAFDVTEAGVQSLSYLSFDGVDDSMSTGTITPGVDKVTVGAGIRKLSDAAGACLVESSLNAITSNGSFLLFAPGGSPPLAGKYAFSSRGTAFALLEPNGFTSPATSVLTGLGDIAGDRATLRANGAQVAQATTDQGTGNYLAYPLYIGRRGGTSEPFNGQLYSLVTRFAATDGATVAQLETWINGKTGAYS
jgi:hypothetical protein